jgi:hypothetical protein
VQNRYNELASNVANTFQQSKQNTNDELARLGIGAGANPELTNQATG